MPFGLRYQICNRWLVELMATAWGGLTESTDPPVDQAADLREAGVFD